MRNITTSIPRQCVLPLYPLTTQASEEQAKFDRIKDARWFVANYTNLIPLNICHSGGGRIQVVNKSYYVLMECMDAVSWHGMTIGIF